MKWPTFSKKRSGTIPVDRSKHLDLRLLKNVRERRVPAWRQLKYVGQFFSKKERISTAFASLLILGMLLLMAGGFVYRHVRVAPDNGGTYVEAMIGQPKYINPIYASVNDVDADITSLIYTGLFHYTAQGTLEPYLARTFTVSEDEKVYTIHMRTDATWSDGEPITTDDVLFTFETIQNTEVGSPLYAAFQGVKVEKKDNETIQFTLKTPFAPFLSSLTVGILPAHVWSELSATSMRLAKTNIQPVGSGPWQFSKLSKDQNGIVQTYTLVPNKNFFGEKPYIQTILLRFFNDYPPAIEAVRNGQAQAISFLPRDEHSRLGSRAVTDYSLYLPQYTALFFNMTQSGALQDDFVRLALAQSIDRQALINGELSNGAELIYGPIPPDAPEYDSTASTTLFDPSGAVTTLDKSWSRLSPDEYFQFRHDALLTEYTDSLKNANSSTPVLATSTVESQITDTIRQEMNANQPYYRKDKNGTVLSITITTVDTPEYVRVANTIADLWRKVGVVTAVQVVNSKQINRTALHDRSYQVLLYGEITGPNPDLYPFWHSSQASYPGLNLSGFSNRNADKILEDARATTDIGKRAELYKKLQKILNDELPAVFLYRPRYTFAATSEVHGVHFGTLATPADRYDTLGDWYIKTKWEWK